jgi:hypothetical protein
MITAIVGLVFGFWCFGPLPGIAAVIMGSIALSQIKKTPERVGGKPFAVAGIAIGSITIFFYALILLWFLLSVGLGGFG